LYSYRYQCRFTCATTKIQNQEVFSSQQLNSSSRSLCYCCHNRLFPLDHCELEFHHLRNIVVVLERQVPLIKPSYAKWIWIKRLSWNKIIIYSYKEKNTCTLFVRSTTSNRMNYLTWYLNIVVLLHNRLVFWIELFSCEIIGACIKTWTIKILKNISKGTIKILKNISKGTIKMLSNDKRQVYESMCKYSRFDHAWNCR